MRRVVATIVLAGGGLLLMAAPASAAFSSNTVGCAGSAVITTKDGKTYTVDANDATVKVPKEGSAAWKGSLAKATHNHSGSVSLKVGVSTIELGHWGPSANTANETSKSGVKELPSIVKQLLPGKYVASGSHHGDEGGCSGSVVVDVQGSALGTVTGIGVLAGTVATGLGLGFAAMSKAVG